MEGKGTDQSCWRFLAEHLMAENSHMLPWAGVQLACYTERALQSVLHDLLSIQLSKLFVWHGEFILLERECFMSDIIISYFDFAEYENSRAR